MNCVAAVFARVRNLLQKAVPGGVLLLLAACSANKESFPINPTQNASTQEEAIVVVGISVENPTKGTTLIGTEYTQCIQDAGFFRINEQTHERIGKDVYAWCRNCNSLTENVLSYVPDRTAACNGGVSYIAHKVPAGDYALGYFLVRDLGGFTTMRFASFSILLDNTKNYMGKYISPSASVMDYTPIFHVAPGEVVYVGDVILDFKNILRMNGMSWRHGNTFEGAKAYIRGTGLSDRMVLRPWTAGLPDPIVPQNIQWIK